MKNMQMPQIAHLISPTASVEVKRGRGKTPSREVANGSFLDSLKMEQSMTRIIDSFTCGLEITICTGRERGRGEPAEKKPHSTAFSIQ